MTTRKKLYKRRKTTKKRTSRYSKSYKSFFYGGRKSKKSLIKGGTALGPASLSNYDSTNQYTYPVFDVTQDPLNASAITDSRQLPNMVGGKKRRRSLRGGSDAMFHNYNNNLLTNSNTIMGAVTGANILTATTQDVYQPATVPMFT
jgi:hypothetical protein